MAAPRPKSPPGAAPAAPPAPLDPFRPTGDRFVRLPLHAIEPFPGNPKTPISGKYRKGLAASLDLFGIRDQLKVWPHPTQPGRYYNLDGNQRYSVLVERAEADLGLAAVLALDPAEHPDREGRLAAIRSEASNREVECRVLAELTRDEARAFNASFDRNHAAYDEAKVADLHADLAERREELDQALAARRAELEARLGAILRPDKATVAPVRPAALPPVAHAGPGSSFRSDPAGGSERADPGGGAGESAAGAMVGPTRADMPDPAPPDWPGPDPPPGPVEPDDDPGPPPGLIPFVLALSPEGFARLDAGLLGCKVRAVRERRVVDAVEHLAAKLEVHAADPGEELSECFVELALRVVQERVAVLDPRSTPTL